MKRLLSVLIAGCLLVCLLPSTVLTVLAEGEPVDVSDFGQEGTFEVATVVSEYPWQVVEKDGEDVLASGNQESLNSRSTLIITFLQDGEFSFWYSTSTKSKQHVVYFTLNEQLDDDKTNALNIPASSTDPNFSTAKGQYSGVHDWTEYSRLVEAGDVFYITYAKNSVAAANEDTVWIKDLALQHDPKCQISGQVVGDGSGEVIGAQEYDTGTTVTLQANADEDSVFVGWVEDAGNGKYSIVSTENPLSFEAVVSGEYVAYFAEAAVGTTVRFGAGLFADMGEALTVAASFEDAVVVLNEDYTLESSVTVPAGVTLLIPRDEGEESRREYPVPAGSSVTAPTAFRTLTVDDGVSLTVFGALEVAGAYNTTGSNATGAVTGPCGVIDNGGTITIKEDGVLYAWGFVAGEGDVRIKAGATVWELMQITDWRGGSAMLAMVGPKLGMGTDEEHADSSVFVFNQYYVQNVEAPMTLEAGATEMVLASFTVASFDLTVPIVFIGEDGMFTIDNGSITKAYDAASDRLDLTVNGDGEINSMTIEFFDARGADQAIDMLGEDFLEMLCVDSKDFTLPLNNNISVEINGDVTINQSLAVLPGTEVVINENATVTISEDVEIYLYPEESWTNSGYVFGAGSAGFKPLPNVSSGKPTARTLKDAEFIVNGTLEIDGAVYSVFTTDDQEQRDAFAGITGAGTVNFNNYPGEEQTTEQVVQSGTSVSWSEITISPVLLVNGNGEVTETAAFGPGSSAEGGQESWAVDQKFIIHYDANGGEGTMADQVFTIGQSGQLTANAFTYAGHTFLGWSGNSNGVFNPFGAMAAEQYGISEGNPMYDQLVYTPINDEMSLDMIPDLGIAEATIYAVWEESETPADLLTLGEGGNVTVRTNNAATGPQVTIVDQTTGTIAVSHSKACTVVVYLNGSYQRVNVNDVNGDHQFTVPTGFADDPSAHVYVAVKGDVNGDGNITSADAVAVSKAALRSNSQYYVALSPLNAVIGDLDGNNRVTSADTVLLQKAILRPSSSSYMALNW